MPLRPQMPQIPSRTTDDAVDVNINVTRRYMQVEL